MGKADVVQFIVPMLRMTTQEELLNFALFALKELVRSHRKKNLLNPAGQIQFSPDFDHKVLREIRHAVVWIEQAIEGGAAGVHF